MCKILLSIKPEYVKSIFEGKKKFEYRKIIAKNKPTKIVIYSTYPVQQLLVKQKLKKF